MSLFVARIVCITGDWHISITYDDQHILGSPFSVRVFGDPGHVKVSGMDRPGNMADLAKFFSTYKVLKF